MCPRLLTAVPSTVACVDAHDGEAGAPRPLRRRLRVALAVLVVLAAGAFTALALTPDPSDRSALDDFYEPPDPLPDGPPGTVVRSARITGAPDGATAYRILYLSRDHAGRPAALSALVFVSSRAAPADGRNVVALAHGTVGVARGCGPSRGRGFFDDADGLGRFVRAGYVVVVPDLEGLGTPGTPGTHTYLIGEASAHATLDAVRAARRFAPAQASERFVTWGVGQGGHTAIFTGQEAASYAPELELAGVAAGAPLANIGRLIEASAGTRAGAVAAAYMLSTWSRIYPQLDLAAIVTAPARTTVDQVAGLCVPVDHDRIGAALGNRDVTLTYRDRAPWSTEPWRGLLARNTPGAKPISVPLIITQGAGDGFVRPSATARFARYLCGLGATLEYRPSRGVAHRDLGEKTAPYVSNWIAGRFAGDAARSTC